MFLPLVALNLVTRSERALSLAPVWVCQNVTLTGSPNLTSGGGLLVDWVGPQAARAGRTARADAPAAEWVRNRRREIAIELPSFFVRRPAPFQARHRILLPRRDLTVPRPLLTACRPA